MLEIVFILLIFGITVLPLFTWIASETETEEMKVANARKRFEKRIAKETRKANKNK